MTSAEEVTCRPLTYWGGLVDVSAYVGLLVALVGIACLHGVTARVSADAYGLCSRTLPRRLSVPWHDIADLRVYVQYGRHGQEIHRVNLMLRDGRTRRLPLPMSGSGDDRTDFDAKLDALRALHRRYGAPESSHVPVISYRTAGRGSALSLSTATPCTRVRAGDHRVRALLGAQPWSMAIPRGSGTAVNRPIQHHRKTVTSRSRSSLLRREVRPHARSAVTAGIRKPSSGGTARVP